MKISKWIGFLLLGLIGLFLLLWVVIQIPKVQTALVSKATTYLSAKLKVPVKIARVDIDFFKTVVLEGVYVEDRSKDTLLYAGKLKASIGLLSLASKTIEVSYIGMENAYVNIYRKPTQQTFNYQFIIDSFASDTTKKDTISSGSWGFDMGNIEMNHIRLGFFDSKSFTDLTVAWNELVVDINSLGLTARNTQVDDIYLEGLKLKYNQLAGQGVVDTVVKQVETNAPAAWIVGLGSIEIEKSFVGYNNLNIKSLTKGMDYNHLEITDFNTTIEDLIVAGGDFGGNVKELSFNEKSGFKLDNLALLVKLQDSKLHAELNEFVTPHSKITDKLTVDIPNITKAAKEIGSIGAAADFDDARLSFADVSFFTTALETMKPLKGGSITVSGALDGTVENLSFTDAELLLNEANFLRGDFKIKGLPDIQQLVFDINLEKLRAHGGYISGFLPASSAAYLKGLGTIDIAWNAKGNIHQFKTDSRIITSAGKAGFDLGVRLAKDFKPTGLTGTFYTNQFHLGKVLGQQTKLGPLTMEADMTVKGKEVINMESLIQSVEYSKYVYRNINLEGTYTHNVANATLVSKDTNLNLYLNGYFNMNETPSVYDLTATLHNANLHALHLYESPLRMQTNLAVHATASDIDSLIARLMVTDFLIENEKLKYTLDTLRASADYDGGVKDIRISSPVLTAHVHGKFNYKEVAPAVDHLVKHYASYYKPATQAVHLDNIQFNFKIGDTKNITQIFVPALTQLKGIDINGSFSEQTHILEMSGVVDEITFQDKSVKNIRLQMQGDKDKVDVAFKSNTIFLTRTAKFYNPSFSGTFQHDSLNFKLGMSDSSSTSSLALAGSLMHKNNFFTLRIPDAAIKLRGNVWDLSRQALLVYGPNYLKIRNVDFSSGQQRIAVNTANEETKNTLLNADIAQLRLGDITKFFNLGYSIDGTINGKATVTNMMTSMGIGSSIVISQLSADGKSLGDLSINANKPATGNLLQLETDLEGVDNKMRLAGTYDMKNTDNNLNFKLDIDHLNAATIQPFMKTVLYQWNGVLQAHMNIRGSSSSPDVTGKVVFKDAHTLGVAAIQTPYRITNQEITINPANIEFKNFTLQDTLNRIATIDGFVRHQKMQDFNVDLAFAANNFQFLNSNDDEAPVYGQFVADVNVKATGPVDNLAVRLNVVTKPKTNLFMNLVSKRKLSGTPEYIRFISFHDDTSGFRKYILDSSLKKMPDIDLSRFKITGTLTATKDAAINIVLNPNTGDNIYVKGDGRFRLNFDSNNDINLFGQYVIEEGLYALSFVNVVKRNFKIDKGSSINLYGNPSAGEMDISAIYTTKAARWDLISDMDNLNSQIISAAKRREPVSLYLKLKGEFLKPEISFDIKVPESKNTAGPVAERINMIKADETALNKQVFGLLLMNKFLPFQGGVNTTSSGGGLNETAISTVGGMLADQLNKLTADYINGVEIEVNSETQSEGNQVSNNVSVMATKQVNDRLKVGVGGKTSLSENGNSTGLAGEYEIQYQLNKSGSASIRLFSTSQQNLYTQANNQLNGVSINHTKAFTEPKELFKEPKQESRPATRTRQ